jgi:hypothetical protein
MSIAPLDDRALATACGGLDMKNAIDSTVAKVYPAWRQMSCTSRGMWVGTAAGSAAGAAGAAINPALGSFTGPIAGTLASTSYIEACQRTEGK